jgi:hypothetical protein
MCSSPKSRLTLQDNRRHMSRRVSDYNQKEMILPRARLKKGIKSRMMVTAHERCHAGRRPDLRVTGQIHCVRRRPTPAWMEEG